MRLFIWLFIVLVSFSWSQSGSDKHHSLADINCRECHSCSEPTHKNPCLKLFPDFRRDGITLDHSADEASELFVIDTLMDLYEPSVFTHKLHAEMAAMAGGCESCHHFNPPGKILSCVSCHEPEKKSDISKPGLKGAYHRQCLNCHREWGHTTKCTICHEKRGNISESKSEFIGKSHEKLVVPQKIVYQTDEEDYPVVTFFHDDHTEKFGFKCVDCHAGETCSRCHDKTKDSVSVENDEHDNCINCHEAEVDDDCEKCHDTKEKKPFDHARHGWGLNAFHKELSCINCHKNNSFSNLNKDCISCHKNWEDGSFNHKVTGLVLDEDHIDNDCIDCHLDSRYEEKPSCNECHDDYFYPNRKPGKRIRE
ncbi:MAG: hypothetical protein D8M58_07170 [Calditrichaeota bacterium]|nr:MAG: hypothetical protein DWQ03_19330 [Calditrichota bacterium]MBL1205161.1 hypothetical protein [Calditrichota bacterium]NOG44991.1 hypothetical protein [Calditrichota bacterium]